MAMLIRFRYQLQKLAYSMSYCAKQLESDAGIQSLKEFAEIFWKSRKGKLTFLHCHNGEEMFPYIGAKGSLLVRKLAAVDRMRSVCVGDVLVLKNPQNSDEYLVRRLAAIEGYEMASKDENDEPFVLGKDECWVLADNQSLKPQEAKDSRIFGPVPMKSITGRVIYCLRNAVNHGPVLNSPSSTDYDFPVVQMELNVDEMVKVTKDE